MESGTQLKTQLLIPRHSISRGLHALLHRQPDGQPNPYHDSKNELSLPAHLAIIAMSRSIRQFLKRRTPFVAAFVMLPQAEVHCYKAAAKWLLEGTVPLGGEHGSSYVLVVDEETDLADQFSGFRKLKELKRAIILLQDDELLSDEIRIAADIVVTVPTPIPSDYRIAARRMGFGNITEADPRPSLHASSGR